MTEPRRIVVIEDSNDLVFMLTHELEHCFPNVEVVTVEADVERVLDVRFWRAGDVAIVDYMLPNTDGRTVLEWMAAHVPFVRRVAWSAVPVDVVGDLGAHAQLQKGVPMVELGAAIRGDDG